MSYKKREKGHWNQGKAYKGSRKAREREYVKSDIETQIAEQDPNFRYRKYKRTPNMEARLTHDIEWNERCAELWSKREYNGTFWKRQADYCRDRARKLRKKLRDLKLTK